MKRKQIKRIIETFWESYTNKDGTKYEDLTPEILTNILVALIEENRVDD